MSTSKTADKTVDTKVQGVQEVQDINGTTDITDTTATAKTASTSDQTTVDMANKIEALLKEGKTLAEALNAVVPKAKAPRQTIDRIAYIKGLSNLVELKTARKTAYAKRSKSKDKPEAVARYQAEIDAATARLNEIISEINSSACPWKKALEFGDTLDGALQYWIQDTENTATETFEKLMTGFTKAESKTFCNSAKVNANSVPDELKEVFLKRAQNNDQRIRTLAQKLQSIEDIKSGARKPIKAKEVAEATA